MIITSPDFQEGEKIPEIYTCDGNDIAPDIIVDDVPDEAKSLALIMDDPDAPMHTWTHWIAWNIPPGTKKIKEGMTPEGTIEGITSAGNAGYHGPCPTEGEHRYFFRFYALDTMLKISEESDRHKVEQAMSGHIIETSDLMGLYEKED
ncbi:MAG: YbhB/YbcL family Raf kinase inhibitor-like protein [Patescibacteria group bacterium]